MKKLLSVVIAGLVFSANASASDLSDLAVKTYQEMFEMTMPVEDPEVKAALENFYEILAGCIDESNLESTDEVLDYLRADQELMTEMFAAAKAQDQLKIALVAMKQGSLGDDYDLSQDEAPMIVKYKEKADSCARKAFDIAIPDE